MQVACNEKRHYMGFFGSIAGLAAGVAGFAAGIAAFGFQNPGSALIQSSLT